MISYYTFIEGTCNAYINNNLTIYPLGAPADN